MLIFRGVTAKIEIETSRYFMRIPMWRLFPSSHWIWQVRSGWWSFSGGMSACLGLSLSPSWKFEDTTPKHAETTPLTTHHRRSSLGAAVWSQLLWFALSFALEASSWPKIGSDSFVSYTDLFFPFIWVPYIEPSWTCPKFTRNIIRFICFFSITPSWNHSCQRWYGT